jgi:phage-related protein
MSCGFKSDLKPSRIAILMWKVKFFQTDRGDYPVKDFILEQEEETQARIILSIELLRDNGPFLKPPHIKKLRSKFYELRILGKVPIRIFYTIFENEYYLLHAFKKKSQKTPAREMNLGIDRMREII